MHIDILVIIDESWIPLEIKYKTKGCEKTIDGDKYFLKDQSAQDCGRYDFLKDISRIEYLKNNLNRYEEGYAIFLTNDLSYTKKVRKNTTYEKFSLEKGVIKNEVLDWSEKTSIGTKKNRENPIVLNNDYEFKWRNYSKIDDSNTGEFQILIVKV